MLWQGFARYLHLNWNGHCVVFSSTERMTNDSDCVGCDHMTAPTPENRIHFTGLRLLHLRIHGKAMAATMDLCNVTPENFRESVDTTLHCLAVVFIITRVLYFQYGVLTSNLSKSLKTSDRQKACPLVQQLLKHSIRLLGIVNW